MREEWKQLVKFAKVCPKEGWTYWLSFPMFQTKERLGLTIPTAAKGKCEYLLAISA